MTLVHTERMRGFSILVLILLSIATSAQTANQFNSWWYYAGSYKITHRVSLQSMYSWNRSDFIKNWQQSELRGGTLFELNRHFKSAVGYEWVVLFPYGEFPVPTRHTEHRIYEELKYETQIKEVRLSNYIRAEHRYLNPEWQHRIRLQSGIKFPVLKKREKVLLGISVYDQVIFNTSKQLLNQYLAQNRLYGGVDIIASKAITVSIGYLNNYIYLTKNRAENDHTFIFSIAHYLNMTKKKRSSDNK